jgi:putative ABC transport system substrate-binding protein
VNLIAATGGTASALAAKNATKTIPVVFTAGGDPVKIGLVASLNRPGGNVTGASQLTADLEGKKLELLRELVPAASTIAVLVNRSNPNTRAQVTDAEGASRLLERKLDFFSAATDPEIETAFEALVRRGSKALLVLADPFFDGRRNRLVALSVRYSLPTVYAWREYAEAGGLMSYGTNIKDAYRVAGLYTGRILKGEKPAEMPVQAAKVELVINRKAAKALGIAIPQNLLLRADEILD